MARRSDAIHLNWFFNRLLNHFLLMRRLSGKQEGFHQLTRAADDHTWEAFEPRVASSQNDTGKACGRRVGA